MKPGRCNLALAATPQVNGIFEFSTIPEVVGENYSLLVATLADGKVRRIGCCEISVNGLLLRSAQAAR
jgi:hypothetical protein